MGRKAKGEKAIPIWGLGIIVLTSDI